MNAVARLWAALDDGDIHRAAEELHPHAVVDWPHSGQRFATRDAYLAAYDALDVGGRLDVRRVVTQGRSLASEVHFADDRHTWAIASFFRLHDGRILKAVEYWVRLPHHD